MTPYRYHTASRTILGDLLTPVSAYLKVRDSWPQSALLESSDYHGGENAKSYIALRPAGSVSVTRGEALLLLPGGETRRKAVDAAYGPAEAIGEFLDSVRVSGPGSESCGLYGYTSFNAVRYTEGIEVRDEGVAENDAPDMLYTLFRTVLVFDHFRNELTMTQLLSEGEADTLDELERTLRGAAGRSYPFRAAGECASPLTDDEHRANIRRGIAHCLRGDVFQIVLSRRFTQRYEGDDFTLYRALRSINPSPYLFYFDMGGFRLIGSSPETHCRVEGGRAFIDPIAGTAKRTGDPAQDRLAAERLRADPKENAEHVMLVDLARNDLSRNCRGVRVEFFKDTQFYSHVIHLVSRVSGELLPGVDPLRAFLDTFPAGTLSGAPKVMAMRLISRYEPHCRGAYGGCVGFIGMDRRLNQAITIRTFVSRNGELWFQAGGGIVAKSDVERELQEVNNKLGALRKAIETAERI